MHWLSTMSFRYTTPSGRVGTQMVIEFRRSQDDPATTGRDARKTWHNSADPVALPPDILDRHGARILRPATAPTFAGAPAPRSTIYRSGVLQIPNVFFEPENRGVLERFNEVLAAIGLRLAVEAVREAREARDWLPCYPDLHRRVPLEVVPGSVARPVDAWLALQTLRAAAVDDQVLAAAVARIELEHLLIGSTSLLGEPSTEGHSAPVGQPSTEGHSGPASYSLGGTGGRAPVYVMMSAPHRRSLTELGMRRPVVAVLDTGLGEHHWLDKSTDPDEDTFVHLDAHIQDIVVAGELHDHLSQPLQGTKDAPVFDTPLLRELDTHSGHGTFIAGIVRQVAPDARVRCVRIMHDDGVVYENDLLRALRELLAQAEALQSGNGDPRDAVDVISLSLGYYSETSADQKYTSLLADYLARFAACGVLVVASAGNSSTDRPCYPAAIAPGPGAVPIVISVGALNPNGSYAFFSNDGPWVRCWATGAAVVSTFPMTYNGSQSPIDSFYEPNAPTLPQRRETIDPDDFRSGFATWSGTSFAAPLAAAALASALLFEASRDPGVSLAYSDAERAVLRASRAIRTVGR